MSTAKKAANNLWLQITSVLALAIAFALIVTVAVNPFGIGANASDFAPDKSQSEAIAGGVTNAEYKAAIDRTLECTRDTGAKIIELRYEDYRNVPVWNYAVDEGKNAEPGSASNYDICWMKYSRDVEIAWDKQEQAKVPAAKIAADESAALTCAAEERLGVDSVAGLFDLVSSGKAKNSEGDVARCFTIATQGFDLDEHPPILVK